MAYDKLNDICQRLGYHGICPEALTEIRDMLPQFESFMEAGRKMFAPVEETREEYQPTTTEAVKDALQILELTFPEDIDAGVAGRRHNIAQQLVQDQISRAKAIDLLVASGMSTPNADRRVATLLQRKQAQAAYRES